MSDQRLPNPHDNEGPLLVRTVWSLLGVSGAVVTARLYTKLRKTRRLYWDDVCIILAWLAGMIHATPIQRATGHGLGRHMAYLEEAQREEVFRLGVWSLFPGFISPMAGRIAFCITVLWISGTDARVRKWPIHIFIAGQLIVNISAIIMFYSQCGSDISLIWTAARSPAQTAKYLATCEDSKVQTYYGYFQGSFNTLTDAFLTLMPAILIEHTRLKLKHKLGLACLLCLSVLAMIASIVKTYEARALSEVLDYSYDLCAYIIWISVELNVVIVTSSLPLIRSLFVHNRPKQQPAQLDLGTWNSFRSAKRPRANLTSIDSQEEIIPQPPIPLQGTESGIQVTHEVTVTYQTSDQAFVHAALVGLIEGEIANPKLTRR